MPQVVINNFNGGIAEDVYNADKNFFERAVHLDNFTERGRLRPYRQWEEDSTGQTNVENFITASNGSTYGLGDDGASIPEIYEYSFATGWSSPANNVGSGGNVNYTMLFEHQGYLYFWGNGGSATASKIGRWKIDETVALDEAWFDIPATVQTSRGATITLPSFQQGPGYRFPKTDQAYFAYANALWSIDIDTDTPQVVLILPQEYQITTLSYWQNYLAVGVKHREQRKDSKVFLWDTISADPTFVLELPEGELRILRNLGGELAAVLEFGATTTINGSSLIVSTFNGGEFIQRKRLIVDRDGAQLSPNERKTSVKNNQMYFATSVGSQEKIYRFGINGGQYCLTEDRLSENDTGVTNSDTNAIEIVGDTMLMSYDDTTVKIALTDLDKDFTNVTPIYQTIRFFAGDARQRGKLTSVGVTTITTDDEDTPTPSTATLTVKYRIDDEQSFTTLGTHTATTQDFTEITEENTGVNFPDQWRTIQFQVEWSGLAQLTEFTFKWDQVPNEYL